MFVLITISTLMNVIQSGVEGCNVIIHASTSLSMTTKTSKMFEITCTDTHKFIIYPPTVAIMPYSLNFMIAFAITLLSGSINFSKSSDLPNFIYLFWAIL